MKIRKRDGFKGERALFIPQTIVHEMENDLFMSALHITHIGYYPEAMHHYRERLSPIDQFILIYCVEGAGWYRIGQQMHNVSANQYFIIPAGVEHAYGADERHPWTIYWIHFKGNVASNFVHPSGCPVEILPGPYSRNGMRTALFEEILHTLEMGYGRENLLYSCSALYHYLGTLFYIQPFLDAEYDGANRKDRITAAIHFMRKNIGKKLTLKEIAASTGYSPAHFSVLFNRRTGYSPIVYFNQLKIQQACQYLDFTGMKMKQICLKIGIDDCYYFSRLFVRIMGMSPRTYKSMKKG